MLPCLLAAPTLVRLAGRPYLCRPLTLGGFATLLRNAADALGMDGDAGELPEFADPRFRAWLDADGAPLLFWECLRRDNPITLAECESLAAPGGHREAVLAAALRRAATAVPGAGKGKDVSRLEWGGVIHRFFAESGSLPGAVADLTLDQAWLIASGGEGFDRRGRESDEARAAAQAAWEARHREDAVDATGSPPAPAPVEVPEGVSPRVAADLGGMGLRVVGEANDGG